LVRNILGQEPFPWRAFWRKNGTEILTIADGGKAMIWDASTGRQFETVNTPIPPAYSPETDRLASVTADLTVGSILDVATTTRHNWRLPEKRIPYAWNRQGTRIFWRLSDGNTILGSQIRDAATDRLQASLPLAAIAAWSPDGDRIAIVGGTLRARPHLEELAPRIEIWDSHNGKAPLKTLDAGSNVECMAWSPDGTRIASGSIESVQLWDAATGRLLWSQKRKGQIESGITFSADGRRLASGAFATLDIWDVGTGENLGTFDVSNGQIQTIAWSPGGERLAVGSTDGTLKILAMDPQVIRKAACGILYRNLTLDEWDRTFQKFEDLVGKISYRETCAVEPQPASPNR
jgi:Tol biopolymer transport system component